MSGRLQRRLDAIRSGFEAQAPAAALEVMHRATADLVASGQAERALAVGDSLPPFSLPDQDGALVTSDQLLDKGPLILSFFRGHW